MAYSEYQKKDQEHFSAWAPHFDSGLDGIFFRASYRAAIKTLLPHPRAHVLDVACGTGGFIRALLNSEPSLFITGVDYTPAMLAEAEIKFQKNHSVRILHSVAEKLAVQEQFDYVYCLDSFHHFQHADEVLEEMCRVLKPFGTILILDPIFDGWKKIVMSIAILFLGEAHIFKRTTNDLHALFALHKLKIIKESSWFFFFKIFTIQKQ